MSHSLARNREKHMKQLSIAGAPRTDEPIYANLQPLLNALVQDGNKVVSYPEWRTDQGGWYAALDKPINFALIRERFHLPVTVELGDEIDTIFCSSTFVEIRGGRAYMKP